MATETTLISKSLEKGEKSPIINILSKLWGTIKRRYKKQFILIMGLLVFVLILEILTALPGMTDPKYILFDGVKYHSEYPPSWKYWLGTNSTSQDVALLILHGTKNSLYFGIGCALISTAVALVVGIFGPFIGGVWDTASSFITNIAMVFPQIPFILFISSLMATRSWVTVMLIIGLFSWPWAARAIRSQVLTLRERNFIKVSKMSALGNMKIAFSEIIPNVLSYVILVFSISFGIGIITEAGISMLGLGDSSGNFVTLGYVLWYHQTEYILNQNFYHIWLSPGIVLTLIFLIFYVIQSSFIMTFNPRTRENM
ncbi:MAG: ABC transporter permease [Candidatus Lokiarchaeota archaeon]|nr:ABC transporter permease [Candidatus Lokiarchaeota archaeon]